MGPTAYEAHVRVYQRAPAPNLVRHMKHEVALTYRAHTELKAHLLQHFDEGRYQEDLCFALWRPSTGTERTTALIDDVLLPEEDERLLHGNASFTPDYLARAITTARKREMGLTFLHSHPGPGWQDMSAADVVAERDVLAYPAAVTELPLLGLTIGSDGYWSARTWHRVDRSFERRWCDKVRIVGPSRYEIQFGNHAKPATPRRNVLRRTFDTWGRRGQDKLSRLNIGIVGLGSVGSQVAEAVARLGIESITLVDPDSVEEHNLDRLLNATANDIGLKKVEVAAKAIKANSTALSPRVISLAQSVHERDPYRAILDCDLVFSCVDRPVARDVLNFTAISHLVPVIDGGVAVQIDPKKDSIFTAHWRTQLVTPYHQCMRCSGQYSTGMVTTELDGSLDDPDYIQNLPESEMGAGANVFPFSQNLASMEVNLSLRYLLAPKWWPTIHGQTHHLITGRTETGTATCHDACAFRARVAKGDLEEPHFIIENMLSQDPPSSATWWKKFTNYFGMFFGNN